MTGEAERFFAEALGVCEGDQPSPCTVGDQDDSTAHDQTSDEAFSVDLAALNVDYASLPIFGVPSDTNNAVGL